MFQATDKTTGRYRVYPHTAKAYVGAAILDRVKPGEKQVDVEFQLEIEDGPDAQLPDQDVLYLLQRAVSNKSGISTSKYGATTFRVVIKPAQQSLEN